MLRIFNSWIIILISPFLFGNNTVSPALKIISDSNDYSENCDRADLKIEIETCFNLEPPQTDKGIALSEEYLQKYGLQDNISDTSIALVHYLRANFFHMAYEFDNALYHYNKAKGIYESYKILTPDIAYFLYRPLGMLLHKSGSLQ
jgi:hypothetical protein